jgi:poly-gamma-glutamate capsule biosynthesis protein CapA/YwtB (metallophosphatase superfamily)
MAREGTETRLDLDLGTDGPPFNFQVLDTDDAAVAINVAAWTFSFMVKRSEHDTDAAALITKTSASGIAIAGTHNAAAASSTQRVTVTITDTDTDALSAGMCVWELKRTDAGAERVVGYGDIRLHRTAHQA